MSNERRLGRGLESLMGRPAASAEPEPKRESREDTGRVRFVPVSAISPNPFQPRRTFDTVALGELADSIRTKGVLQPVLVRRSEGDGFELIAGERRWRAAKEVGLSEIPAIVLEASEPELVEIALVENIQREDLNPIDRARSCQELIRMRGCTHDEVARRLGKDRATVTNLIRLLGLPESCLLYTSPSPRD